MVPDITHAYIRGKLATDVITDREWLQKTFVPTVQKRGAAIIAARKGLLYSHLFSSPFLLTECSIECGLCS